MSAIYVSDMQNDMEPVQVFVRIRPEHDDKGLFIDSSNSSSGKGTINNNNNNRYGSSLLPSYIELIDDKTLTIPATDENKTNIRKPSLHQINPSTMTPSSSSSSLLNTSTIIEKRKLFSFDKIFPKSCNQEDIYYQISPMVKATVRGYNTTVFAYGCTGSGKSYTMTGTNTSPGIIPRAISEIFSTIEQTAAVENNIYFYVRISYVELYNNNFRNLLDFASDSTSNTGSSSSANNNSNSSGSGSRKSNELRSSIERDNNVSISDPDGHGRVPDRIEVRESVSAGVFLAGANLRVPVTSAQEAFQLIAKGNKFRAVGATQCNDFSSRYVMITYIYVYV